MCVCERTGFHFHLICSYSTRYLTSGNSYLTHNNQKAAKVRNTKLVEVSRRKAIRRRKVPILPVWFPFSHNIKCNSAQCLHSTSVSGPAQSNWHHILLRTNSIYTGLDKALHSALIGWSATDWQRWGRETEISVVPHSEGWRRSDGHERQKVEKEVCRAPRL